jgi:hypothetical protein
MPVPDLDSSTQLGSAAALGRHRGTWDAWSHRRRRLVAAAIANRLAMATCIALAVMLERFPIAWLVLAVATSLGLDIWLRRRLGDAEGAEGASRADEPSVPTPDELELLERLEQAGGERRATMVAAAEVLTGSPVARRHALPTRELLVVRSGAEAIELAGVMLVVLTAPAPAGVAVGAGLWLLGGRAGTASAKMVLGQRLYRTPVDDEARARWLNVEDRLIIGGYLAVLVVGLIRLI